MTQSISDLWSIMTVFFSQSFLDNQLFLSMVLLLTVFAVVYFLLWFFDKDTWGIRL